MKAAKFLTITSAIFLVGALRPQAQNEQLIEPVAAAGAQIPGLPSEGNTQAELTVPADVPPLPTTPSEPGSPADATPGATVPFAPLEDQKQEMKKSDEGFIIKQAELNDIFQFKFAVLSRDFTVQNHL